MQNRFVKTLDLIEEILNGRHPLAALTGESARVVTTHYQKNGRLRSTFPMLSGRVHGTARIWYANGHRKCQMRYRQGLFHGLVRGWWLEGAMRYERHYRNGAPYGYARRWSKKGRLIQERAFLNGIRVSKKLMEMILNEKMTVQVIRRMHSLGVRAACIEAMGYARFLSKARHEVLETDGRRSLVRVHLNGDKRPLYLVKVRCPITGTFDALRVVTSKVQQQVTTQRARLVK